MAQHVIIVGGGISGLAALEQLSRVVHPGGALRATLLEASSRPGGLIRTDREDGYVMEAGPDVMLASKPAAVALCETLGIARRLIDTQAHGSFVLDRGTLRRIPEGMSGLVPSRFAPFVRTSLLSPAAKVRAALEWLMPPRRTAADETVEQFVVRRLGREMYDRLIEPLLSGIFAGDGARLSIAATFPQLVALEREHGGLVRGMLARRRGASAESSTAGRPPRGLVSFPGGLSELVESLEHRVRSHDAWGSELRLATSAPVVRLARASTPALGGFTVTLASGEQLHADVVIVATPAHVAASLLDDVDPALTSQLAGIEYASTVTINVAYRGVDVPRSLAGTGYVVPRAQRRPVLACTFSSRKFAGRAPADHALFRLYLGGIGRGDYTARGDAELTAIVREELRDVLGIAAEPVRVRINRFERALPQYNVGHLARLDGIEAGLAAVPGLLLAGNAYHGVGIPDCVRSGQGAALAALAAAATAGGAPAGATGAGARAGNFRKVS